MNAGKMLLVVTEDGYGKRVPLDDLPTYKKRGGQGVGLSSADIAEVLVVEGNGGDVVIATKNAKVERVKLTELPVRRRTVKGGRLSKGAKVTGLQPDDLVAAVSLAAEIPEPRVPKTSSAGTDTPTWPWRSAGLRDGEEVDQIVVLRDPRPLAQIESGGDLAVERDEWAQTDVHRASSYSCAHCGQCVEDPHGFYEHLDRCHVGGAA